jgi:hypothetical protein
MPHNEYSLSITTTASGVAGGIARAVSEQVTQTSISIHGIIDVAFYALVSATVGYSIKLILDRILGRKRRQS